MSADRRFTPAESGSGTGGIVSSPEELSPWADIVGPCYTTASLARELGIAPEAVLDAAADLRALRLLTGDNVALYPAFQVIERSLIPGLQPVLVLLRSGIDDPWTWAQWLVTVSPETPIAPKPIDQLAKGKVDPVLRDAAHTAAAWAA